MTNYDFELPDGTYFGRRVIEIAESLKTIAKVLEENPQKW